MGTLFKFASTAALALATTLVFSCSSGDDEGGGNSSGGGSTSGSISMQGEYHPAIGPVAATYWYAFRNYSNYEVRITVGGEQRTMHPYPPLTGDYAQASFMISARNASVSYTPANKVRYEKHGDGDVFFYDK